MVNSLIDNRVKPIFLRLRSEGRISYYRKRISIDGTWEVTKVEGETMKRE